MNCRYKMKCIPEMKRKNDAESQRKGFEGAARALECDESEERFDAALKKITLFKKDASPSSLAAFWEKAKSAAEAEGYESLALLLQILNANKISPTILSLLVGGSH